MELFSYHDYGVDEAILTFNPDTNAILDTEGVDNETLPSERLYGVEIEFEFEDEGCKFDKEEKIEVYHEAYGNITVDNPNYDDCYEPDIYRYYKDLDSNGWFHIEEDGSLEAGFEMISAPLSRKAVDHFFGLEDVVDTFNNSLGHVGTNGLHIHVFDKESISKTRLAYLVYRMQDRLAELTRRSGYARFYNDMSYTSWATTSEEFRLMGSDYHSKFMYALVNRKNSVFGERNAINLQGGKNHVEFRFFRVPYKSENFTERCQNYVKLIDRLLEISKEFRMYQLMRMDFEIDDDFNIRCSFNSDPEVEENLWDKAIKQYRFVTK